MNPQTPSTDEPTRPAYEPPTITTLSSEELLEQVGPALTCSAGFCTTN